MSSKTLKEIIRDAPSSKIVKPSRIGLHNIHGLAHGGLELLEGSFNFMLQFLPEEKPLYKKLIAAQKNRYLQIEDGKLFLLPVDPVIEVNYGDEFLMHSGLICNGGDNRENLQEQGVFGNPAGDYPTYLMTPTVRVATYQANPDITLFIDKKRLLEKRTVFIVLILWLGFIR